MKFIDDKNKKLTWWSRNYAYLGTLLFVTLCVSIYTIVGNGSARPRLDNVDENIFYKAFVFDNLIQSCINAVFHLNIQHVLTNMLCFLICGFYIERKTGTVNFILLTMLAVIFETAFTTAAVMNLNYAGASGVQFFFYGYIIIDYIFSFQKVKRNKTNTIVGGVILSIIYVCMCFCGGTETFSFKCYPYDLINNAGHYAAIVPGIFIGLIIQISQLKYIKCSEINYETELTIKQRNIYKKVYIVAVTFVFIIISFCAGLFGECAKRKYLKVNIVCNYEDFNETYNVKRSDYKNSLQYLLNDWIDKKVDLDVENELYIFEIYQDSKLTKKLSKNLNRINYNLFNAEFIPLSESVNKTYYIEISKGYYVNYVNYHFYCDGIELVDIYHCAPYFSVANNIAKENEDFSFKLKNPNNTNLKVLCNGVEVLKNEDVYTVKNVNEQLNITFEY